MIHLVVWLPLPYQLTLCQTLNDYYGGHFVAWFAERTNDDFPYRSNSELRYPHHYLSEVGYRRLFEALNADPEAVVILSGWSSPMTNKTLLITALRRIPVFIWADHPHPKKRRWLVDRSRKLYLWLLGRLVSGFLACGQPTVEHLVLLGIKRQKITNFPCWVELPREWAVPKRCVDDEAGPLRLLVIGRHTPVKQFHIAIEAVALANKRAGYDLAVLVIVGDGPERANLEALARSLGGEEVVKFTGWLESAEVNLELRESDGLIVPSLFEPYGVVVLEAMAAGRPVLASENVIAALDRDEGTGAVLIHRSGNVESIADQIALLAHDNRKLLAACIAARQTAEKWAPSRAAAILDEVLRNTRHGRRLLTHRHGIPNDRGSMAQLDGRNHETMDTPAVATSGRR